MFLHNNLNEKEDGASLAIRLFCYSRPLGCIRVNVHDVSKTLPIKANKRSAYAENETKTKSNEPVSVSCFCHVCDVDLIALLFAAKRLSGYCKSLSLSL